jgi:hypothetical protein
VTEFRIEKEMVSLVADPSAEQIATVDRFFFCSDLFLGVGEIWNPEMTNLSLKNSRVFTRLFDLNDPGQTLTQAGLGCPAEQEWRELDNLRRLSAGPIRRSRRPLTV